MTRTRLRRSLAAGVAVAALCGSLTGCGSLKELTSSSRPLTGDTPKTTPATTSPAPEATQTTTETAARASGPLDTGTVTHVVKESGYSVQLTYWTKDNAKLYTASSTKTISVAVHVQDADSSHAMTVTTFQVTQDDGTKRVVADTDSGSFDVTPPYPYDTVLTLPSATAGATSLTLTVQLDLLVQTAPKSASYYRSTALDTLTLPLITNGAAQ